MRKIDFRFSKTGVIKGEGIQKPFKGNESLISSRTLSNLEKVRKLMEDSIGCDMEWTVIRKVIVYRRYWRARWRSLPGEKKAWNVLIEGKLSNGQKIYYHRKETASIAAGQTLLYANGSNAPLPVSSFLHMEHPEEGMRNWARSRTLKWAKKSGLRGLAEWLYVTGA